MKWKKWIVSGICFGILLFYLDFKQDNMVVSWTKPGAETISKNAGWIYGKYSSGKVRHYHQIVEPAQGWDALLALWPISLALIVVSFTLGLSGGYTTRDNKYAEDFSKELARVKNEAVTTSTAAKKYHDKATSMENDSIVRHRMCDEMQKKAAEDVQAMTLQVTETTARAAEAENKLAHLEKDYKNRGDKIERLQKGITERIDKLEQVITGQDNIMNEERDKHILTLGEENLALIKDLFRNEAGPKKKEK